jgi:ribonuclease P protein component
MISKQIGIVVPKRCGKAFQRNHIKRYVREWFQHQYGQFSLGMQLVVDVKNASWNKVSYGQFFQTLNHIVDTILRR